MRKALVILSLPLMILILGFLIIGLNPTGAHASPVSTPSTLPACVYEDGAGQPLCLWDASEQGNGMGTDAIGGDCSLDTVGTIEASNQCQILWYAPATFTYAADGSVSMRSEGLILVAECLHILYQAETEPDTRNALENAGWTVAECFRAFNEE